MFINYRRLFNLRFSHEYYSDGHPDGLQLDPTEKTMKKLKGANMLFRKFPKGITVLYRTTEDEKSPLIYLDGLNLRFTITVRDSARFQTITDLDESSSKNYSSSRILLFRNKLKKHSDDPKNPELLHHLLTDYEETVFGDDELSGKNLLGILELTCGTDKGDLFNEIQEYLLHFRRKESYWKYLIVDKNRKITDRENLIIEDIAEDDSNIHSRINFSRQGDVPNDSVRINGLDTIIFRSEDPIPFFEVPRAFIQLKKADGSVYIKHLPNPTPSEITKRVGDQLESEIYVYI